MNYLQLLHWSFFCAALLIAVLTETLKKFLRLLPKKKWLEVLTDARLIPALCGVLLGCIPGVPLPEVVDLAPSVGSILYFATAGIVSAWLFSVVEKVFRTLQEYLPEKIKDLLSKVFDK